MRMLPWPESDQHSLRELKGEQKGIGVRALSIADRISIRSRTGHRRISRRHCCRLFLPGGGLRLVLCRVDTQLDRLSEACGNKVGLCAFSQQFQRIRLDILDPTAQDNRRLLATSALGAERSIACALARSHRDRPGRRSQRRWCQGGRRSSSRALLPLRRARPDHAPSRVGPS